MTRSQRFYLWNFISGFQKLKDIFFILSQHAELSFIWVLIECPKDYHKSAADPSSKLFDFIQQISEWKLLIQINDFKRVKSFWTPKTHRDGNLKTSEYGNCVAKVSICKLFRTVWPSAFGTVFMNLNNQITSLHAKRFIHQRKPFGAEFANFCWFH